MPPPDSLAPSAGAALSSYNLSPRRQLMLPLLSGLLTALAGFFTVHDPDIWWRVKTGELIAATRRIPLEDPFSFTAPGPWNNVEPLSNLYFYAWHELGQLLLSDPVKGLQLGSMLALFACGVALHLLARHTARKEISANLADGIALCATALVVSIASFRFGPKPDLFSLLGLALLLHLLHRVVDLDAEPTGTELPSPSRPHHASAALWRAAAPIGVLLGVWMLLHRGATLGLALVGLTAVVLILPRTTRTAAGKLAFAFLLGLLAIAATPSGLENLVSAFQVLETSDYRAALPEWQPPSFAMTSEVFPALLVVAPATLLLAAFHRQPRFGLLVVCVVAVFALRHVRLVPLLAVALLPEFAFGVASLVRRIPTRTIRPPLLAALLALPAVAFLGYRALLRDDLGFGAKRTLRPVDAVEFLKRHPPPGRMYHSFNHGSFLLYSLAPEHQVFIDGRNDLVYPAKLFVESALARTNASILKKHIQEYDIGFAVLEYKKLYEPSYLWLLGHPDWQLVYQSDNAAIMVKRSADSEAYLAQHGYTELRPHTAIARAQTPEPSFAYQVFVDEVHRLRREAPLSVRANLLETLVYKSSDNSAGYAVARRRTENLIRRYGLQLSVP